MFPGAGEKGKHLLELRKPWGEFPKASANPGGFRAPRPAANRGQFRRDGRAHRCKLIGAMLGHKSMQSRRSVYARALLIPRRVVAREIGQAKMLELMDDGGQARETRWGKKPKAISSNRPKLLFLGS